MRQADPLLIDPNQVYRFMVLAKGLRNQSRYCWAGMDKVASRAVAILEGRNSTAFVVSFASALRQLECKSGVSPRFFLLEGSSVLCLRFPLERKRRLCFANQCNPICVSASFGPIAFVGPKSHCESATDAYYFRQRNQAYPIAHAMHAVPRSDG